MAIVTITRDNKYLATDVYQWDQNRILKIYGLEFSSLPEIHFANGGMTEAIVKQATVDEDGGISVEIPNVLLEVAKPLMVYICFHDGTEFMSKCGIKINVRARTKPADYIADDDEKIYSYNALENLVYDIAMSVDVRQSDFENKITEDYENLNSEIKNEVVTMLDNMTMANSIKHDGYYAEEFEFANKPGKTVFNDDGSIVTTYDDGTGEVVIFNDDGSITTQMMGKRTFKTTITKINTDGSIKVTEE